ncbi:MAG: phage holin family protein [Patescibacteria group bacterium]
MKTLANLIISSFSLMLVSKIVTGVTITGFWGAVLAVIVMAILNLLVKPILFLLTLPVTIVTFGLFTFVLNAIMFLLSSRFVSGFSVDGFGSALIGSIIYSIFTTIFSSLVR